VPRYSAQPLHVNVNPVSDHLQADISVVGVNGVCETINVDRMAACTKLRKQLQNFRFQRVVQHGSNPITLEPVRFHRTHPAVHACRRSRHFIKTGREPI
jgi:hypothetical protein